MQRSYPETILHRPLTELELSEAFKKASREHEFHTLADLLRIENPYDILKLEGFDYHLLAEYVKLLEKYKVAHYLN